jgi:hypothetical protein
LARVQVQQQQQPQERMRQQLALQQRGLQQVLRLRL